MRLYEFEGKRLLQSAGIPTPRGHVARSPDDLAQPEFHPEPTERHPELAEGSHWPVMAKAQLLRGKRSKAGLIAACQDQQALREAVERFLPMRLDGERVAGVLIEKRIDVAREYYLGITYQDRAPCAIASARGGVDIEEARAADPSSVVTRPIRFADGLSESAAADMLHEAGFGEDAQPVAPILAALYKFFAETDALIAEINPLARSTSGAFYALDAKIEIDDDAAYRLGHLGLPDRLGSGREPTELEILARRNDLIDSRGAAGRMFYEIEGGNIIVLAAGGGTSMEALDDLYSLGGRPAVFTEYSGNPTGEKVKGLTKIALAYRGEINAIWVIGGRANFTDIYETLINGILAGIEETEGFDRSIPIIVRRAGPRDEEAYEALRRAREDDGYNIFIRGMATSIADSARMVIYQANKHYTARRKA